jgi:hypothetical protein
MFEKVLNVRKQHKRTPQAQSKKEPPEPKAHMFQKAHIWAKGPHGSQSEHHKKNPKRTIPSKSSQK